MTHLSPVILENNLKKTKKTSVTDVHTDLAFYMYILNYDTLNLTHIHITFQ